MAYGGKLVVYSAGAVDAVNNFEGLSAFHTVMLAGGSASIINAIIGIVLSIIGCVGIVALFFLLNYLSYYFIQDKDNKKERMHVAFGLHLMPLIFGIVIGTFITVLSPAVKAGLMSMGTCILFSFMWIPFFWGFMFTGPMKTLPPKTSRYLYPLPEKANWILLVVGVILVLIDIIVFGPGIYFT